MRNKDVQLVSTKTYKGFDLRKVAMRPNSLAILDRPSRVASTLFYPNGTILKDAK
jgi:hypothetical protein